MTYISQIPPNSMIASALDRIDYQDAFAIQLKQIQQLPPAKLPPLFFRALPKWFGVLIFIRERIASWLGLKTAAGIDIGRQLKDFTGEPGQSIALFHILGNSENEILSGEDDQHLDFRLSFFSTPQAEGTEIMLATTVQMNNWIGKLYFLPVGVVHRLIVPLILKRMARLVEQEYEKKGV
ncbi:MAG: DUF2867 domain-containing protein [Bacteroidota bacterium]